MVIAELHPASTSGFVSETRILPILAFQPHLQFCAIRQNAARRLRGAGEELAGLWGHIDATARRARRLDAGKHRCLAYA
ncbi:hypothetical protein [Dokdonella soli]|uniref:hypothetical protein n=1 Tax=Dokdonella soli TaxID=529810 RepID=UPI0031DE8D5F